jgi:hypothetical protein
MPDNAKRKKQARTLGRMLEIPYTQALRILDGPPEALRPRVRDAEIRRSYERLCTTPGYPVGIITHPALPAPRVEIRTLIIGDSTLHDTALSYRSEPDGPVKAWLTTASSRSGPGFLMRTALSRFIRADVRERTGRGTDGMAFKVVTAACLETISVQLCGRSVPAHRIQAQDWDADPGAGWEAVAIPFQDGHLLYCGPGGSCEAVRFGIRSRPEPDSELDPEPEPELNAGATCLRTPASENAAHDTARMLDEQILRFGRPVGVVRHSGIPRVESRPGVSLDGVDQVELRFGERGQGGSCVVLTRCPATQDAIRQTAARLLLERIMGPGPYGGDAVRPARDLHTAIAATPAEPVHVELNRQPTPATRVRVRGAETLEIPYGDGFIVYCGPAERSDTVQLGLAWSTADIRSR